MSIRLAELKRREGWASRDDWHFACTVAAVALVEALERQIELHHEDGSLFAMCPITDPHDCQILHRKVCSCGTPLEDCADFANAESARARIESEDKS